MTLKILIDSVEKNWDTIRVRESIGSIAQLSGEIDHTDIDVNSLIELKDDNGKIYFNGRIIRIERTEYSHTDITAVERAWDLRALLSPLQTYTNWKLTDILNGQRDASITDPTDESEYLEVTWTVSGDTDDYIAVISGKVGEGVMSERLRLTETDYGGTGSSTKAIRSEWNTDSSCDDQRENTWTELYSFHVEDENGIVVNPNGNVTLKDSFGTQLAQVNSSTVKVCAKKDSNGHYGNSLLYNTVYNTSLNVSSVILNDGLFSVSGNTVLDILKEICSKPVSIWGTNVIFQANFEFDGTTIIIKEADKDVTSTIDNEVIDITYSKGIEELANKITCTTNKRVVVREEPSSISTYGAFNRLMSVSLTGSEADVWIADQLNVLSKAEEEIKCTVQNMDIQIGDRIRITALDLDKEMIVQELSVNYGRECSRKMDITLSEYPLRHKFDTLIHHEEDIEMLYDMFLYGGGTFGTKQVSYAFTQLLRKILDFSWVSRRSVALQGIQVPVGTDAWVE